MEYNALFNYSILYSKNWPMADTNIIFESRRNLLSILLKIAKSLTSERNPDVLLEKVIDETMRITNSDGGTLYLTKGEGINRVLEFVVVRNTSLKISKTKSEITFKPLTMFDAKGNANHANVATHSALTKTTTNVKDVYETLEFDFSGAKAFDKNTNYKTKSILSVPLLNHEEEVIGVIQLLNAQSSTNKSLIEYDAEIQPIVEALASYAAIAIENQIVLKQQKDLLISLSAEPNTAHLIDRILREAQRLTNADGGTLYLLKEDKDLPRLEFSTMKNKSLNISKGGISGVEITIPPIRLFDEDGLPNHKNIASYTALTKKMVNVDDAYHYGDFDFSGVKKFDEKNDYSSRSFLTVPLLNHVNDVIGVIQLVNAIDSRTGRPIPFSQSLESIVEALASYAAIALENDILVQDHKDLLEAFIKCIAKAIDAKSSHTSAHCQRVPALTALIAQAACDDVEEFNEFQLTPDQWYELHVASWLHDCGKLATPDFLLDKSTKLHLHRDGIKEVTLRMECMKKDLEIESLKKIVNQPDQKEAFQKELEIKLNELLESRKFLEKANVGGEFMTAESLAKVKSLATLQWKTPTGELKDLLDENEVKNLCIERGTLSKEERLMINNHMVVTIDMLESLPFPKKLKKVPEYAGGHHEKMDGTGFPKGLKRDQMSVPARMMAIADIFEALTSKDRPYKKPMSISVALTILKKMKEDKHIDPDLFNLFVKHKVWLKYAERFLGKEQIDLEDASKYID
jgi:HD-GYP domain-containing protein (c-di-GMP phosphodiesterase class II)